MSLLFVASLQGGQAVTAPPPSALQTFRIDGDANDLDNVGVAPHLYSPTVWYADGRTYFTFRSHITNSDAACWIGMCYQGQISYKKLLPIYDAAVDYHDNGTVMVDSAGYVYVGHASHANDAIYLYKSQAPHSVDAFDYFGRSANFGDYPTFYKLQGQDRWAYVCRTGSTSRPLRCGFTSDLFTYESSRTFTEVLADNDGGTSDVRNYPLMPTDYHRNGWHYLIYAKRVVKGGFTVYKYKYLIRTQDFLTWHNIDSSFSTDGIISEANAKALCAYSIVEDSDVPDNFYHAQGECACVTSDNRVYIHNPKFGVDYLTYWTGSAWADVDLNAKGISIPLEMWEAPVGTLNLVSREGTTHVLFRSSDNFASHTTQVLFDEPVKGTGFFRAPTNIAEATGRTAFIAGTNKEPGLAAIGRESQNDILIREYEKPAAV